MIGEAEMLRLSGEVMSGMTLDDDPAVISVVTTACERIQMNKDTYTKDSLTRIYHPTPAKARSKE